MIRSFGAGDKLVLASHNKGKIAEFRDLLAPLGIALVSSGELGLPEPEETGDTFAANAQLKADATAQAAGLPALADDSGIEIEALGGAPGIYSARWAGEERDFKAAMARVEKELREKGALDSPPRANFTCMLCLATPEGDAEFYEGKIFGHLTFPPRGTQGFGYDPIFVPDGTFDHLRRDGRGAKTHHVASRNRFRSLCESPPAAHISGMDPFGIYIHWPYCAAKCPYCDFNSHVRREVSEAHYLASILRELDYYAALAPGRIVSSIFFGGGTPSLMEPATAAKVLEAIAGHWAVLPGAEITLEANPSSVEAGRFADFRRAGINRVSLGVQSLHDDQLQFLGRLHNAAEARAAIEIANTHFERVSFDLIYARPGQTPGEWRAELGEALALAAGHLSLYQLTIEPGTAFHRLHAAGKLHVPQDDDAAALYELTQEVCDAAGLGAYEVSNHARPGEEARHNLLYWRYGEYAGVGPGAHGRIRAAEGRLALSAERDPAKWAAGVARDGHGLATREVLTRQEEAEEMLLMGLRLAEGFSLRRLAERTGFSVAQDALHLLAAEGLLRETDGDILSPSPSGRLVLNSLIEHLASNLIAQNDLAARGEAAGA